ncbi:MAG: serine aminopeptidase domain-containing protein [Salinispira sp.]
MREEHMYVPIERSSAFLRLWQVRKKERGIVLITHDIGEHSGRYHNFALFLMHHGYSVAAYDLRGHGFSALHANAGSTVPALRKAAAENPDFLYMPAKRGWEMYLNDFMSILQYILFRYKAGQNFIFGQGIGSTIVSIALSILPEETFHRLSGIVFASPPSIRNGKNHSILQRTHAEIKKHGDRAFSPRIEKLMGRHYYRNIPSFTMRTEQDWVSSDPDEVDNYISDPMCETTLRLGLYKTILEGQHLLYSRKYRPPAKSLPMYMCAGRDDPLGALGKGAEQLREVFQKSGWEDIELRQYNGRHALLHDRDRVSVYADCLNWIEEVNSSSG